jgi:PD-(D/E)XK nuclease superfamily
MHPLYLLKAPVGHPTSPDHWSYSTLKAWRQCPRRWWLERCRYPNGPDSFYPAPVSAAALEGQLVHKVVEEWGKAIRRGEDPGQVRLRFKVALRDALDALKDNPRVNTGKLGAGVSLDVCVAKAHELIGGLEPAAPNQGVQRSFPDGPRQGPPMAAEEFWLVVHDPPLKCQLDRIRGGVVTDFKTGSPDPSHIEQLHFYAVLWWLKYGEFPEGLELRYPGSVIPVPVPSPSEINSQIASLQAELFAMQAEFETGNPPARPSVEHCRYCPVRQLCNDYWRSPETTELRLLAAATTLDGSSPAAFGDVELVELPCDPRPDNAVVGQAVAANLGPLRVRIGGHLTPPKMESVVGAKLLGARLIIEGGERVIATTPGTEVFWEQ